MKFGTHYLIGINSFSYDPFGTIDRAARLGFDALEIPFGDLMAGGGEERGLRIADYANKKGSSWLFAGVSRKNAICSATMQPSAKTAFGICTTSSY